MVLAVGDRVTQGFVLATAKEANAVRGTQAFALAAIDFPSKDVRGTQTFVQGTVKATVDLRATSARLLAAVRGRIENRRLRAWTFSLDGHDFYVLRLGETATLVYDVTTGKWSRWEGDILPFWRADHGMNWLGMGRTSMDDTTTKGNGGAKSQIVAGDDTFGLLWTIDPTSGVDDNPSPSFAALPFLRRIVGGVPMAMRETKQVGAAYLTASFGSPQITAATICLRTSIDFGKTWTNHGTVTVTPGDYSQEFVWRSLGLIQAPGRIFEITDSGATVRIDGLDIR